MEKIINAGNIKVVDANRDNIQILRETLTHADFESGKMECDAYIYIVLDIISYGRYRRHPVFTNIIVDLVTGDVYREDKENLGIAKKAQITPRSDGYSRISICKKLYYVHRIIMESFLGEMIESIGNKLKKLAHTDIEVHHCKLHDCSMDSIYNLRIVSHSQNCRKKSIAYNTINADGYQIVKDSEIVAVVKNQRDVAKWANGTQSAVSKACRGLMRTFHGYEIVPIHVDVVQEKESLPII